MLLRDNVYESLRTDILTCRLAHRLAREDLITVQPPQGYRVNPISRADARDLLRFRLALEPACVADAIESASDATLKALDKFRRFSGNHEDFIAYNRAFHSPLP